MKHLAEMLTLGWNMRLPKKEFAFWPTPTRSDAKNRGTPAQLARAYIPLSCRVRIKPNRTFYAGRGRANPEFVEWLMGWPMSWSDLGRSATDRFLSWRRSLSSICESGSRMGD